jgi:phasin family protein
MTKTDFSQAYSMDKYAQGYMKQMEEIMSAGKQSTDAWMKFNEVFSKGMEDMVKTYISKAKTSGEKNATVWKDLMACKTINEVTETQARIAKEVLDDAMSTSAQISEMSVKVAMECLEPINKQVSSTLKRAQAKNAA